MVEVRRVPRAHRRTVRRWSRLSRGPRRGGVLVAAPARRSRAWEELPDWQAFRGGLDGLVASALAHVESARVARIRGFPRNIATFVRFLRGLGEVLENYEAAAGLGNPDGDARYINRVCVGSGKLLHGRHGALP